MLCQNRTRLIPSLVRTVNTSVPCRSHYDALGLTPHATQHDIKTAYYKLSMVYHPDKSKDDTSARKFRAISEAYEVLGNVRLKKMYDKGMLRGGDNASTTSTYHPDPEPEDPTLKFYKSHTRRQVTPTMGGRTTIYDFDAWSKNHYGTVFRRKQNDKHQERVRKQNERLYEEASNQDTSLFVVFSIIGIMLLLILQGTDDYDVDKTKKEVTSNETSKQS